MAKIEVISFDLDGTLVDDRFVNSVWFEGIPRLYSAKKGLSFGDATKAVKREYDKVGKEKLEWYDLRHWMKKFGLNVDPQELLGNFKHTINTYPEVPRILDVLKRRGYRLIIVTNAYWEFVRLELKRTNMENYFEKVFSSTSDFGLVKKTANLYEKVCNSIGILPPEMVHVGDDWNFDFHVPRRLGILAFYLDRAGKHEGEFVIHSLEELDGKLEALGVSARAQ